MAGRHHEGARRRPTSSTATPADQTALLDLIAYRRNASPELTPGIEFFTLVRRMTVDAFYTSEIGIKDIDYRGNSPMASYPSPTEAIAYALKQSGLPSLSHHAASASASGHSRSIELKVC